MNTTVKNSKLILGKKLNANALKLPRGRLKPGQQWMVYQNVAFDSSDLGSVRFLCCGAGCTYAEPPTSVPDSHLGIGWRFALVGRVNLETGEIEAL